MGLLGIGRGVAELHIETACLGIEHDGLSVVDILLGLAHAGGIALEADAVAVVILACALAEELLHIVAAGEVGALVVEVDHVGIPVRGVLTGEEGGVARHGDDITVALDMEEVETFGEGIDELLVRGAVLTEIDLRLAVTGIAVVLAALQEVVARLVVVLVDDGHGGLLSEFPACLVVGVIGVGARTSGADDDNVGIGLAHAFIYIFKALSEFGGDLLLVADAEVLQTEGLGMALLGAELSPLGGGGIAIGPLDEVEGLGDPLVHLGHRAGVLCLCGPHAPTTVGTLAAHTGGQDGQRLHAEVFAELEVLIVAETHRLVVAPGVLELLALLLGTDGGLPAVGVPETVAATVDDTAAGEAQELRLQVGEGLGEILAQTVTFIGVLGHEGEHIGIDGTRIEHEHLEGGLLTGGVGGEHGLVFLPAFALEGEGGVGEQLGILAPALRLDEGHAYLLLTAIDIAEEGREVVLRTGLHGDAVEAVVLKTEASPALIVVELTGALDVEAHVGGVVGMDALIHAGLEPSCGVAWADHAPRGACAPAVALDGTKLEGAVLYELGIETTVGGAADVFEENTDEFVTDGLAACGGLHGLLGVETQRCCQEEGRKCCSSVHIVRGV